MIVLDPAHGGTEDMGKSRALGRVWPNGETEKSVTLRVATHVGRRLGSVAELTRRSDENHSLAQRIDRARRAGALAFVSVHAHDIDSTRPAVFVHPEANARSGALGHQIAGRLGCTVQTSRLAVLDPSTLGDVPACVVDVGPAAKDPSLADRYASEIASALSRQEYGWKFTDTGSWGPLLGSHDTANIAGFRGWVLGKIPDASGNNGQPAQTAARTVLNNLWGNLPGFWADHHELIAWSVVRRARDAAGMTGNVANAPQNLANRQLQHLARRHWWKLFIENADRAGVTDDADALTYDNQQSPGFYGSMMAAMEAWALQPNNALTRDFATYEAMHGAVVANVKKSNGNGGWESIPAARTAFGVSFPMTRPPDLVSVASLQELVADGIACPDAKRIDGLRVLNTPSGNNIADAMIASAIATHIAHPRAHLATDDQYLTALSAHYNCTLTMAQVGNNVNTRQILVKTLAPADQVGARVNAIFQTLTNDLNNANNALGRTTAIARCLRNLHVTHAFNDANGRLNTMLLQFRLLTDVGLQPAVIPDHAIFGGRQDVATLATALTNGMLAFRNL